MCAVRVAISLVSSAFIAPRCLHRARAAKEAGRQRVTAHAIGTSDGNEESARQAKQIVKKATPVPTAFATKMLDIAEKFSL